MIVHHDHRTTAGVAGRRHQRHHGSPEPGAFRDHDAGTNHQGSLCVDDMDRDGLHAGPTAGVGHAQRDAVRAQGQRQREPLGIAKQRFGAGPEVLEPFEQHDVIVRAGPVQSHEPAAGTIALHRPNRRNHRLGRAAEDHRRFTAIIERRFDHDRDGIAVGHRDLQAMIRPGAQRGNIHLVGQPRLERNAQSVSLDEREHHRILTEVMDGRVESMTICCVGDAYRDGQ